MKSRILWSAVLAIGFAGLPAASYVHADNESNQADLDQAVKSRMQAGIEKNKMERSALANDPKVIESKAKMEQADKDWSALIAQADDAVKTDPDYAAAQKKLDAAQDKLKQAKVSLAQQRKQQRDAEIAAAKARAQSSGSGGGGSTGSSYRSSSASTAKRADPQSKAVHDAQAEVDKAQAAMTQLKLKKQREMEQKDDWKAAKAAKDKAHAEYEAAVRPALDKLKKSPEYVALLKQENDAQAKIDAASAAR
jgi:hypothetical protein